MDKKALLKKMVKKDGKGGPAWDAVKKVAGDVANGAKSLLPGAGALGVAAKWLKKGPNSKSWMGNEPKNTVRDSRPWTPKGTGSLSTPINPKPPTPPKGQKEPRPTGPEPLTNQAKPVPQPTIAATSPRFRNTQPLIQKREIPMPKFKDTMPLPSKLLKKDTIKKAMLDDAAKRAVQQAKRSI